MIIQVVVEMGKIKETGKIKTGELGFYRLLFLKKRKYIKGGKSAEEYGVVSSLKEGEMKGCYIKYLFSINWFVTWTLWIGGLGFQP